MHSTHTHVHTHRMHKYTHTHTHTCARAHAAHVLPLLWLLPSAIHIGEFGKLWSPVIEIVVVLAGVGTAGPQGAEASSVAASALVSEGDECVEGWSFRVVLCVTQSVIQNIAHVWRVVWNT